MNSIQVYSDIPPVDYQEEMWYGSWQLPSIHHYLETMDTNPHGVKTHQAAADLQLSAPMRLMPSRDPPLDSFSAHYPRPAYPQEREQQILSSWSAPAIRFQYPPVATDDLSYRSDHSSTSSVEARSPPGVAAQLSSPTTTEMEESGPLTPPTGNSYYGQSNAYPYQQFHQPTQTYLHSGPVTLRDVQYEHDLDESNAYHVEPTTEQWNPNVLYRHCEAENDGPEPIDDVDEVDTVKYEPDSDYTPTKTTRSSRRKSTKYSVMSSPKKERLPNGKVKPATQAVGNNSIIKSRAKTSTHRRRSSRTMGQNIATSIGSQPIEIEHQQHTEKRRFICSFARYGCPSTFANKNEWKRHVYSQHLQLGFYRCDLPPCNALSSNAFSRRNTNHAGQIDDDQQGDVIFNDFNRKDLFTQHLRRMHSPWNPKTPQTPTQQHSSLPANIIPPLSPPALSSTRSNKLSYHKQPTIPPSPVTKPYNPSLTEKNEFENSLESIRQRCWHQRRYPPPKSICGFCHVSFTGEGSWESRMEHVGRHLEELGLEDHDDDDGEQRDENNDYDDDTDDDHDDDGMVKRERGGGRRPRARARGRGRTGSGAGPRKMTTIKTEDQHSSFVVEEEDPDLTAWAFQESILVWDSNRRTYVLA